MNFGKAMSHGIKIEALANNGFLVTVGPVRLAYADKDKLIADLKEFLDKYEQVEGEYNKVFADALSGTDINCFGRGVGSGAGGLSSKSWPGKVTLRQEGDL